MTIVDHGRVQAQDSPFAPYWWGIGLAEAGVTARPDVGTYGRYAFADLPPVPAGLDAELGWLAGQPAHLEWTITGNATAGLLESLAMCRRAAVPVPPAFTRFMSSSTLQERVRSATACFLDLASAPVPIPGGGHLLRFLADQQGCLYWHLYVTGDGADHAVVCSTERYDAGVAPDPADISFCAESFEVFLYRFWVENEIWFAVDEGRPLPAGGAEYLRHYRERAGG